MTRKTGLGRGLDALIPSGGHLPESGVIQLDVECILPNPRQPRSHFDANELVELAVSIKEHGVIQPLIVTAGEQLDQYVLIAGERRLLAARQAGLAKVPVIVREANEQQRLELALIENVQRADLSPLEAAEAYRQLADDFGLAHEEIARQVGKSRVTVTNTLRLLKLAPEVQQALAEGRISEGHARALLALTSAQAQAAALQTILAQDLNVRQAEALVRRLGGERPEPAPKAEPLPEVLALEERLQACLGTRVSLNPRHKSGSLVIHYYSDEELNAIVDRILGEEFDN
jgi:ParB family transcriptional regulator, chromosome partitioning protein